jgi:hypothetical protein
MHQALSIYLFPPGYPFFFADAGRGRAERSPIVAFVRVAFLHPGCFMVNLDPAKQIKATMTTPSSNK